MAQEPLPERDASRLMVLDRGAGRETDRVFRELPELLRPGDLLVLNRSRVFPARLRGRRPRGGPAEILLVRPLPSGEWEALLRPGRRLRPGDVVSVADDLSVRVEPGPATRDGRRRVRLLAGTEDVSAILERRGHTPLPPYVSREDRPEDRGRYQTVYARETGSVAAPTAGLHFTQELLDRLARAGVARAEVLLHVGPGTFKPVKVENVEDHTVEAEPFVLPGETAEAIRSARARGGRVVAVGTTTVRTLETMAEGGGGVRAGAGETSLVILPGFRFRVVDALLTNFHLPRSSLLLLACAFAGRDAILGAYARAARSGYRFYSYGDAMLIL